MDHTQEPRVPLAEAGSYAIETGRNQYTLLVNAYCPWCNEDTDQSVYYSYGTAIGHCCRKCEHLIWNETRYSHTTARHLSVRKVIFAGENHTRNWTQLFIGEVPVGTRCLLCRAWASAGDLEGGAGAHPGRRCDRESIQ